MVFNTFLTLAALIAVGLVSNFVSTHPIEQEGLWVNPCDGSDETREFMMDTLRHHHHRNAQLTLKSEAQTAKSICNEIMNRIVPIIGTSNANVLNSEHPLSGFPPTTRQRTTENNISIILLNYIDILSQAGVFLEQMFADTLEYTEKLSELESKYRNILCEMHLILRNEEVASNVTRDIMSPLYRNIDVYIDRHRRNYLIIRDVRNIFSSISESIDDYIEDRLV